MGFEIKQDEVTSLRRLLDHDIASHLEKVAEVSDQASRWACWASWELMHHFGIHFRSLAHVNIMQERQLEVRLAKAANDPGLTSTNARTRTHVCTQSAQHGTAQRICREHWELEPALIPVLREWSIEKALDKMAGDWDGMTFELGSWKETGEAVPLGPLLQLGQDAVGMFQLSFTSPTSLMEKAINLVLVMATMTLLW